MPLVQAKCESCGGNITVDSSLKAANCPYCGGAYVVQDAINHYNSVTNVDHLYANVVNVVDDSSAKARLEAAEAYMKIKKYDLAEKEYLTVTQLTPQNYYGWCGAICAGTHEFTRRIVSRTELNKLNDYSIYAQTLIGKGTRNDILERWAFYYQSETKTNNEEMNALSSRMQAVETEMSKCNGTIQSWREHLQSLYTEKNRISQITEEKHPVMKVCYVIGGIIVVTGIILWIAHSFMWFILALLINLFVTGIPQVVADENKKKLKIIVDKIDAANSNVNNYESRLRELKLNKEAIQESISRYD